MSTNVDMICVGDELLDGRIRDANGPSLGARLDSKSASLRTIRTVTDDDEAIVDALDATTARIVVVSGGLGPTDDDRTREAAARWSGSDLELDEGSLDALEARYVERNRPFTENNRRQAFFPADATVLSTEVGSAPGFRLERDGQSVFFFPGVPREFSWFVERYLLDEISAPAEPRSTRSFHFHGMAESALATRLAAAEQAAERHDVKVGYRADYPIIELKLTGRPDDLAAVAEIVEADGAPYLVGTADSPLPARLGQRLLEHGQTIATAESCTAGGIGALITEVSGSSGWFGTGYITYSNTAKMELLGVSEDVLLQHGAVSAQTVCQMAAGARRESRADFAIAVSGIAGPGGGTREKPVGTVHFGLATPDGTFHRHVHYRLPTRGLIRAGTAYTALAMALWVLEDRLADHRVSAPYTDDEVWAEGGISPRRES